MLLTDCIVAALFGKVQVSQIARQRLLTVPRATRPHEGYVPFAHNPTATQRESALNQVLVLGSPLNGRLKFGL
jgi:hypothetical protein